ncbi:MAG: hypothetical protein WAV86_06580 [Lutibacter sp.]
MQICIGLYFENNILYAIPAKQEVHHYFKSKRLLSAIKARLLSGVEARLLSLSTKDEIS